MKRYTLLEEMKLVISAIQNVYKAERKTCFRFLFLMVASNFHRKAPPSHGSGF